MCYGSGAHRGPSNPSFLEPTQKGDRQDVPGSILLIQAWAGWDGALDRTALHFPPMSLFWILFVSVHFPPYPFLAWDRSHKVGHLDGYFSYLWNKFLHMEIPGHRIQMFLRLDRDCLPPSSMFFFFYQFTLPLAVFERACFPIPLPHWLTPISFGDDEVSDQRCFYVVELFLEFFFFYFGSGYPGRWCCFSYSHWRPSLIDQVNYQQYIQDLAYQCHGEELALFLQNPCELLWACLVLFIYLFRRVGREKY